jgi:putative DNA primase/helicase
MLYEASQKGSVAVHRVWETLKRLRPDLARLVGVPAVSVTEDLAQAGLTLINECYEGEENGDATLLAHLYRERLCYDHDQKQWYIWNGQHWQLDKIGLARQLVAGQLVAQYRLAASGLDKQVAAQTDEGLKLMLETHRDSFLKRCKALSNLKRIKNVLELAQTLLAFSGAWDSNPWLLGVQNGVVDLKTGNLLPGQPSDYIRKVAPTVWEGLDTPAPRFEQFMREIFDNDVATVNFIQRLLGYGTTGLTSEHILPIFYGEEGRNGKDTLLETVGSVLGELAGAGTNDLLIDSGGNRSGQASPHLYRLMGQRLCWVSETRDNAALNTNQVKLITGGGRVTCRALYSNELEFQPSHLLILQTNHKPRIPVGGDRALWERLVLVPFNMRFVEKPTQSHERPRDPHLREKLNAERTGILTWLVRGCLGWQQQGLKAPANVSSATKEYQADEDTLQQFIDECCVVGASFTVTAQSLYDAFKAWGGTLSQTMFGKHIKQRFEKKRSTGGRFIYQGIDLIQLGSEQFSE